MAVVVCATADMALAASTIIDEICIFNCVVDRKMGIGLVRISNSSTRSSKLSSLDYLRFGIVGVRSRRADLFLICEMRNREGSGLNDRQVTVFMGER